MPTILVVDDSKTDRILVGGLLEKAPGFAAAYAENGVEALTLLESPDGQPEQTGNHNEPHVLCHETVHQQPDHGNGNAQGDAINR